MKSDKVYHALAFLDHAKKILTEDQYAEVNKKAAPAAGGIAKKINKLANDRLNKAFLESPTNREGLGQASTLAVVNTKGSLFNKDEAEFENKADFGFEACGGCVFYLRNSNQGEVGSCLVVEGDIPWFSTSKYFISSQEESISSFSAMRQQDRVEELLVESFEENENFTKEDYNYTLEVEFAKTDEDKKLVYGIVLAPNEVDTQNDIIFPHTIEKAAHNFLQQSRVLGEQHETVADSEVVESYITPEDTVLQNQEVKKGTWIIVSKIHSDELWNDIKAGHYTGYSIGGKGKRIIPISEDLVE